VTILGAVSMTPIFPNISVAPSVISGSINSWFVGKNIPTLVIFVSLLKKMIFRCKTLNYGN